MGNHRIESEKRERRAKWPAGSVSEVLGHSATGAVRMRTIRRELEDLDNPQESCLVEMGEQKPDFTELNEWRG